MYHYNSQPVYNPTLNSVLDSHFLSDSQYRHLEFLQPPAVNNFLNNFKDSYKRTPTAEGLCGKNGICNKLPGPSCTSQLLGFLIDSIKHWINPNDNPSASTPDSLCIVLGAFGLLVVMVALGLIMFYGGEFLNVARWVFNFVIGGLGDGARYTSNFISKVATDITESESAITLMFKYAFDFVRDSIEYIVEYTYVNRYLLLLNIITAFLTAMLAVINETLWLESEFEGSLMQKCFKVFDWPFQFIMDFVEKLDGGKGILYYIAKFFVLPFEGGALALGFVVSGILYLIEQILEVIREKIQE